MKIALGNDHAGVPIKPRLKALLEELGHSWEDAGSSDEEAPDYPDYAEPVARAVAEGRCDRGVLICGTGIGMSMAANKVPGVRAAVVHDEFTARSSRTHNHSNVLCMGARVVDEDEMLRLVRIWLETGEEGGRHDRRVAKIAAIEKGRCCDK